MSAPRVFDNDQDEICVWQKADRRVLRRWLYESEVERRANLLSAREFVEGWYAGHDEAKPTRGFWVAFTLLALWAAGCFAYGLFLLHSHYPDIGAPL